DERPGGFEPLRFVPKGKRVVLGLVTTKRGGLESKDELKRRIEDAARFVDVDQLCLSPQCGVSSTKEGNDLSQQQQWDKLRLVVETAQEGWGTWCPWPWPPSARRAVAGTAGERGGRRRAGAGGQRSCGRLRLAGGRRDGAGLLPRRAGDGAVPELR